MGNTESTGNLKMCSGNSLYTYANRKSLKEQMNTQNRVGWSARPKQLKTIPGPQYRSQATQQQFGQSQRQQQQAFYKQEPIEMQVITSTPVQQKQAQQEPEKQPQAPSFNEEVSEEEFVDGIEVPAWVTRGSPAFKVYVECIKDQIEAERDELPALEEVTAERLERDIRDRQMQCFDGLFGNVIVHDNGLVLYTDINGEKYCEDFDPARLIKTFPLGISGGDMSKSIWFNDVVERDAVFDAMSVQLKDIDIDGPPSYQEVMAQPEMYQKYLCETEEEDDCDTVSSLSYRLDDDVLYESELEEESRSEAEDDHVKVFEGLGGMQVIVHEDNLVLFTDINGDKHCRPYNPHRIRKTFPMGISGGDLPKSIWFSDQQERDLCFSLMQWNMSEVEDKPVEKETFEFRGLYGVVRLTEEGEINYTSLTGEVVTTYFEPEDIHPTFPMGISYGGLPKTIWFDSHADREACFRKMQRIN